MPVMRLGNIADIAVHDLRRVALGIDRNEVGANVLALVAERLQPAVKLDQRCRADFRAVGEAEEQGRGVPAKRRFGDFRAFLVDQRERRAERLLAVRARYQFEGTDSRSGRHEDNNTYKDGSHHDR